MENISAKNKFFTKAGYIIVIILEIRILLLTIPRAFVPSLLEYTSILLVTVSAVLFLIGRKTSFGGLIAFSSYMLLEVFTFIRSVRFNSSLTLIEYIEIAAYMILPMIIICTLCWINNLREGKNIMKVSKMVVVFSTILLAGSCVSLLVGLSDVYQSTFYAIFALEFINDACKANCILLNGDLKYCGRKFSSKYIRILSVVFVVYVVLYFSMFSSSGKTSSSEPWRELGVSEAEYWEVYKFIADKSTPS